MNKSNLIILITASIILCLTQTIYAKTFHVGDGRELFLAFSEASNNGEDDIIYLAAGVYKGEFIFETSEANSLTLTSEPGLKAEEVVFDGEEMVRPLYISSVVAADIVVKNISIQNGKAEFGSGIVIFSNGIINFDKNFVYNNSGGGVYLQNDSHIGKIFIFHNRITGNFFSSFGGGIKVYAKGDIIFIDNYVCSNTSTRSGGGVYIYTQGDILFNENSIMENVIDYDGNFVFGGGIFAYTHMNIALNNNIIAKNISYSHGSGIYVNAPNGNIFFNNNNVSQNISKQNIAGIYIENAENVVLTKNNILKNECLSSANYSDRGSGIFLSSQVKNSVLRDNTIKNNISISNDALRTYNTGSLILSNNTIIQNNSCAIESYNASSIDINSNIIKGSSGKGIYITSTSETSITCTIHNNVITGFNNSSNEGAGIFVENFELIDIAQNLITNNKAVKGAGVFLNPASTLFLNSNTIADNIAEEQGGGLYVKTSNMLYSLSVKNNIFWNNSAAIEGDDIYLHGFGGNPRELHYNNIGEISGTFENASNNLSIDPLFYSPETGDYHLRSNSPCINTGNIYYLSDLDGNSIYGEGDIGAYEYNPTIPHPADTNKNFIIEESEYTPYNNSWHKNLPWSTELTEIEIEYNTRAGFLIENGGAYTNTGAMKPLCWTPIN